jgi:hypothetical protein
MGQRVDSVQESLEAVEAVIAFKRRKGIASFSACVAPLPRYRRNGVRDIAHVLHHKATLGQHVLVMPERCEEEIADGASIAHLITSQLSSDDNRIGEQQTAAGSKQAMLIPEYVVDGEVVDAVIAEDGIE